jgi:hypothetical protein
MKLNQLSRASGMSSDVTVSLSDDLRQRAQIWAEQSGRSLPEFLAETIELSLFPLGTPSPPPETWADEEVLLAAADFFSPDDERRLSDLLGRNREGSLDPADRDELGRLMQLYQERLVRKAIALREAVRRGLRESLAS